MYQLTRLLVSFTFQNAVPPLGYSMFFVRSKKLNWQILAMSCTHFQYFAIVIFLLYGWQQVCSCFILCLLLVLLKDWAFAFGLLHNKPTKLNVNQLWPVSSCVLVSKLAHATLMTTNSRTSVRWPLLYLTPSIAPLFHTYFALPAPQACTDRTTLNSIKWMRIFCHVNASPFCVVIVSRIFRPTVCPQYLFPLQTLQAGTLFFPEVTKAQRRFTSVMRYVWTVKQQFCSKVHNSNMLAASLSNAIQFVNVTLDSITGHLTSVTNVPLGISVNVEQQFFWYRSSDGKGFFRQVRWQELQRTCFAVSACGYIHTHNWTWLFLYQPSGAYIFRPAEVEPEALPISPNNNAQILSVYKVRRGLFVCDVHVSVSAGGSVHTLILFTTRTKSFLQQSDFADLVLARIRYAGFVGGGGSSVFCGLDYASCQGLQGNPRS